MLHAELDDVPLSLDADAFTEFWQSADLASRPGNASRPFFTVRQLELGYRGEVAQAAAGRLQLRLAATRPFDAFDVAQARTIVGELYGASARVMEESPAPGIHAVVIEVPLDG